MPKSSRRLIIMTRLPVPGQAKTRLEPLLGPAGAADLHRRMTERVLTQARRLALGKGTEVEIRHTGGTEEEFRAWLGDDLTYAPQSGAELGARMAEALGAALAHGADKAVLVGCDCPGLDQAVLARAFELLDEAPLVLGPAADGGYYLVGLRAPEPRLFRGPAWGGPGVLARTLETARELGLEAALLPTLADVDRPRDVALWKAAHDEAAGRVSVIIPALNEEAAVGRAVISVIGHAHEVIVADGGSADATAEVARAAGALVIEAPRGRARQMNAAARLAEGGALLFLHADTVAPPGWRDEVITALAQPDTAAGAFSFRLDQRGVFAAITEWGVARRCRLASMPYGDQGLFCRTEDFRLVGGFADQPIMEDWEFVRAMQRRGRIFISPLPAVTSARRWRRAGPLQTLVMNQIIIIGYHLGVAPATLRNWYDKLARKG